MFNQIYSTIVFLSCFVSLNGQDGHIKKLSNEVLNNHQIEWVLEKSDIQNFDVVSHHVSRASGLTHIYLNQTINNIPIYNAITNISIKKDGQLLQANNGFVSQAHKKIKNKKVKFKPEEAVLLFANKHNLKTPSSLKRVKSNKTKHEYSFDKSEQYEEGISASQVYFLIDGQLKLTWKIEARVKNGKEYWTSFFDVNSGKHLFTRDNVTKCSLHKHHYKNHDRACRESSTSYSNVLSIEGVDDGSEYKVYDLPLESPQDGNQSIVKNPASEMASPFGWHDTDGIAGPEYTITRGNNVHSFVDIDGQGQDNEPDGGESLDFLFDHDKLGEPQQNAESDITQLFYVINWMHDFSYFFGFDEAAGNFQVNNYGNPGRGNDNVEGRFIADETNGASFSQGSDGSKGIMRLLPWAFSDINVTMTQPIGEVFDFNFGGSEFGLPTKSALITKPVILAEDIGDPQLTNACDSITNGEAINGNIAMVDRGECDFSFKVFQLQQLGALAVIVCNRDEQLLTMSGGENAEFVTIPSAFMRRSDCDRLLTIMDTGQDVVMNFDLDVPVPAAISSSFDNGIVTHEYAHGISTRFTGGRSQDGCLRNPEEMGEGWSDFISLIVTHQEGDLGSDARGLGTYIFSSTDVNGIRRFPYSTDMSINAQTYHDIRFTGFSAIEVEGRRRGEHEVGEVWASMLWDMYWEFIDTYGLDLDWTNRESGNSKAIQLVFEGMAIQKCSPGFVDGRNAILSADEALYNGENQCLIWDVFARRGLGFDADQGRSSDREDGVEGYLTPFSCRDELSISKSAPEIIDAGDNINVSITVGNYTGASLSGVQISDVVPDGTSPNLDLLPDNANYNAAENSIVFDIGDMDQLESLTLNYELFTDADLASQPIANDNFELEETMLPTSLLGSTEWSNKIDIDGNVWTIEGNVGVFDQTIETVQSINLTNYIQPVMSFRHSYDTELYFAGGDIEIFKNGGNEWESIEADKFLTNSYSDEVIYKDRGLKGFTGNSDGFVISTIDLSEYIDQTIDIRFRYTSILDGGKAELSTPRAGWSISYLEFFDLNNYNLNEACVNSNEALIACDGATTLIQADDGTSVNDENIQEYQFSIFPNPGRDYINVSFDSKGLNEGVIKLLTLDGKIILSENLRLNRTVESIKINTSHIPSGFYFIEFTTDNLRISDKLIISN